MENKKIFYNVDTLRIIFAVIIVYFHILHSNIMKFVGNNEIYSNLADMCKQAYFIVPCFFIIGGFFLHQTFMKNTQLTFEQFTIKKIARLWPVLAFSILLTCIITHSDYYTHFINLFFLQNIGLSTKYAGINWYISPFFWTSIFYFYLLRNFHSKYVNLIIAIIIYFSLTINISYLHGSFGRQTVLYIFNLALLQALAAMGIGYFIGMFYNRTRDFISEKFKGILSFIVMSAIEIYCFVFLIYHFVCHQLDYSNKLVFVIIFSILFYAFLIKKGLLSKLLDNKYLAFGGKYAYSIYVMQQVTFYLLQMTLWKSAHFVSNIPLCIAVSVAFSVAIGIITYYLVEIPAAKRLSAILRGGGIFKIFY